MENPPRGRPKEFPHDWDSNLQTWKAMTSFKQGHLDGMCGIYALMNAIYFLGKHESIMVDFTQEKLMELMKKAAENGNDVGRFFTKGMCINDFTILFNVEKNGIIDLVNEEITQGYTGITSGWGTQKKSNSEDFFKLMQTKLRRHDDDTRPHLAVALLIREKDHWITIVAEGEDRYGRSYLAALDSRISTNRGRRMIRLEHIDETFSCGQDGQLLTLRVDHLHKTKFVA